ncbi:hypothetical protein C8A05DRAFT_13079 [Staphylotrichum tortipilum]|uniref:C2H2-type domain-containing protein n=1 Tax=Staphylotrichum tortipilum TaxID=2831512 RepID=A0AAN6MSA6_9PEZI|nr:hypothetical protein C8A05DRAFT_13079 [Staphylotrichum longicolle]
MDTTSPEPDDLTPPPNPYPSTPRQTASPRRTPRPQHPNLPTPRASFPTPHASFPTPQQPPSTDDDDDAYQPPSTSSASEGASPPAADNKPTKASKDGPIPRGRDHEEEEEEDEDETRPNRWRGHPSTWLGWTERERGVCTALENVRGRELGVHLYNAVGLRRGFRGEWGDGGGGGGKGWDIGKSWTAWPVEGPRGDVLLPRTADGNEGWTVRRGEEGRFAGSELEEEISAAILRGAKERFWKRGLEEKGEVGREEVMPSVEVAETEGETDGGPVTGMEEEEEDGEGRATRKRRRSPSFTPVFSADDDRSYALLRPAARRIMAKLDDTLTILHNQRVAGLGNVGESSASDGDETDAEAVEEPQPEPQEKATPPPKGRGGRPRKVQVPWEGETEQEMLIRVAREGKRKLPAFARAESEDRSRSRSRSRSVGRGRRSVSVSSRASSRASSQGSSQASSRGSSASGDTNREKRIARWGLRDWRDVLGAAALAGFPPDVIARATQRCATLFREPMTMHTLHAASAGSGKTGRNTVRYVPGTALPPSSDEMDSEEEELAQRRIVSRQASSRLTAVSSPERQSETPAPADLRSRSGTPGVLLCPHPGCPRAVRPFTKTSNWKRHLEQVHDGQADAAELPEAEASLRQRKTPPRRRSRSGTPAGKATHFCHYADCPRALEGFTKRTNLARHLQLVHGKRAAEETEEEESADEMDGGVHVDRFLKPIKLRKGWRGDDATQRQARSRKKARAGSEELDSAFF